MLWPPTRRKFVFPGCPIALTSKTNFSAGAAATAVAGGVAGPAGAEVLAVRGAKNFFFATGLFPTTAWWWRTFGATLLF